MKKILKKIWTNIKKHLYLYDWLKPIVCRIWGHKIQGQYMVYEQEKKKNKDGVMMYKRRYDPYVVYSCSRCGKKLGSKRLRRKMKKNEVMEYSKQVTSLIKAKNQQNKNSSIK
jgi:hypothetical protein